MDYETGPPKTDKKNVSGSFHKNIIHNKDYYQKETTL